jgi:ATP-dependent DNA helicase RecG
MNLDTPVDDLPRVGPAYQRKLKRLNIRTVGQLIFHFPHRYEDFSNLIPLPRQEEGGPFSVQGKITDIKVFQSFQKKNDADAGDNRR